MSAAPTGAPPLIADDALSGLIGTMLACADLARAEIRPHFRQNVTAENKGSPGAGGFDPVTVADRAAEEAIRAHIRACYPSHGILGEEYGHEPGSSGITWVIDPIDGTRSFVIGAPVWGTLIAINDGHRPVLGLMDQGFTRERFLGCPSGSFYMGPDIVPSTDNLPSLTTSAVRDLAAARLAATDPRMFKTRTERAAFDELESRVRLSRYGLDCYAYCLLAAGHIDLVVEASLKPYDIQALIPIVEGAGGVITSWSGGSAQQGGQVIAAATADLHEAALDILQRAD